MRINRPVFCDIDCTANYKRVSSRVMHTLTLARGMAGGPWVVPRGRRTDLEELCWVQGLNPGKDIDFAAAGVSDRQAGRMLGNAMSMDIVERLLIRGCSAAGLISHEPLDPWRAGANATRARSPAWAKLFRG